MNDIAESLYGSLVASINERGNTSLTNYESGNVAFYHQVELGVWLEIVHIGENYPSWTIQTVNKTAKEIRTHIEENYQNPWIMTKNNVGVNCDSEQSPMRIEDVLNDLESILYSHDYKNLTTKSEIRHAVNEILKKNSWELSGNEKDRIVTNYFDTL